MREPPFCTAIFKPKRTAASYRLSAVTIYIAGDFDHSRISYRKLRTRMVPVENEALPFLTNVEKVCRTAI
jgi:hypothetical protein